MADVDVDASGPRPVPPLSTTPPPDALRLPINTPGVHKGPPLTGQLAESVYIETAAMPVHEMPDYIEHAKTVASGVRSDLWSSIETWSHASVPELDVKKVHAAMPSSTSTQESTLYKPSARLLNTISLAYYLLASDSSPSVRPIVFHSNPSQIVLGDYLGVQQKPDSASGVGSLELLVKAAMGALGEDFGRDFPWSPLASIGEAKTDIDKLMAQFKAYMANLYRYRPDMATVHGFRLARTPKVEGRSHFVIALASMNACGLTCSPPVSVATIDAWIAHVVMVYDSDATRNRSLSFASSQTEFTRWDLELADSRVLALAPFYVTPPPGRVTFATFEVDSVPSPDSNASALGTRFRTGETSGFVKFSWQDDARVWKERDLLDRLHGGGWLPGLVRPYPSQLKDTTLSIEQLGVTDGTHRTFEMLHLGSIGEPLSQCKTPKEILMVAYDVLETSLNMIELDVIHRDLSWFNILRKPRHDPNLSLEKPTLKRRCIASILGLGHEPCALVADLDHSAVLSELIARDGATRKEKTGTPMFRALEFSGKTPASYNDDHIRFKYLVRAFKELEEPRHRKTLMAAFPEDTLTFAAKFEAIVELEEDRRYAIRHGHPEERYIVKDLPHAPRHDAESIYWVLLWALGRALPHGSPDELPSKRDAPDDALLANFNDFCAAMLKEGSSVPGSGNRQRYINPTLVSDDLLHPRLQYFERAVLDHMATYFSIPWALYEKKNQVDRDHAHTAMRRILLLTFLEAHNSDLDIKLDTEKPRRCNTFMHETTAKSVPATVLSNTGDASTGTRSPALPSAADSAAVAAIVAALVPKRSLEDDDESRGGGDAGPSSSALAAKTAKKRRNTGAKPSGGTGSKSTKATFKNRYTEEEHLDNRSANSLLLKIWKDRLLWFGSGY
ncbi:hypothetical protein AURDEDRAFT_181365 [Auricularia subglabra TFB-10046 SS5]|nr:hypothetical protein AURDEDRAFT_181365 [Auricularia subglabra TFB-10046 SS5]